MNNKDITLEYSLCKTNARAFFDAACLLENHHDEYGFLERMLPPFTVNLMLSCELYYKCLFLRHCSYHLDYRKLKTHDLVKLNSLLVEHLPELAKRLQEEYHCKNMNGLCLRSLEDVLKLNSDNFIRFRYLHEHQNERIAMYVTDVVALARALQNLCDSLEDTELNDIKTDQKKHTELERTKEWFKR